MRIISPSVEIMGNIDGNKILKNIELAGRVCYKSEEKITEESSTAFVRGIISRGHESVLEHEKVTFRVICDRAISHELVRHRIASYSQESSRYCVAGSCLLKSKNDHNHHLTIQDLYESKVNSKNGAWKRVLIKQLNEDTGELCYSKIRNVYYNGIKDVLVLTTRLGYKIICTPDHLIYSDNGYRRADSFSLKDSIYVNGSEYLYRNKDWLYNQNIILNKTFVQIAQEFGFNVSTLKGWARKFGLPKKGCGYFNKGRIPWNKGLNEEEDDRVKCQANALRKYHHCGRRNDKILKENTCKYNKYNKGYCEICGKKDDLQVHHIDEDRNNNYPSNLITLCNSCHLRVHSKNLEVAYLDEITSIESIEAVPVYDIEMDSKYSNFIANGVVVHNCNYANTKFGNEITFIKPCFWDENSDQYKKWYQAMEYAEMTYLDLISHGAKAQEARSVLPNSLKTEVVVTMNLRELRHFLKLRTAKAAHPQMREIAYDLYFQLQKIIPVVFDDNIIPEEVELYRGKG